MSRQINFNEKLSNEDRKWLLQNGETQKVRANDEEFGRTENDDDTLEEVEEKLAEARAEVARLEAEISRRQAPANVAQSEMPALTGGSTVGPVDNTVVDGETPEGAPESGEDDYEAKTVAELRAILADRNKERIENDQEPFSTTGTKAELVERIRQDDRELAEGSEG
jgi:molybdopterin converting factor small subunit